MRLVLEELGTTFIKLGQVLSTRPDLIPESYAEEFKKLQSDTPKADFSLISERLEAAFPGKVDEIFAAIDEHPLASASIAQVHKAVLRDGTEVVCKVLRPGVENVVRGDIVLLRDIGNLLLSRQDSIGFNPVEVIEEFARTMESELNFVKEGRATDRMARQFEDDQHVSFPQIYWEATATTVLTQERLSGKPLSKMDLSQLTQDIRTKACKHGAMAVFKMCLEIGYFHADPHPGNIFVYPDGSIAFIDCGMTGHVDSKTRFQLGQLVKEVLDANLDRTVRIAIDLTDSDPALEKNKRFRRDVWELITHFEADSLEGLDIVELLNQFSDVLKKHKITCPADIVYLIRALLTVEGVAEMLDPKFDLISEAKPLMQRLFKQQYGAPALKKRLVNSLSGYIEIIEDFPDELRDILLQLRRKDYALNLKVERLEELRSSVAETGRLLSIGMILSAMLLSAAILIHSESGLEEKGEFTTLGTSIFGASILFILFILYKTFRRIS